MSDYISREAAIDGLRKHLHYMLDDAPISDTTREIYEMAYRHCADKINSIPAADVRENKPGKWERTSYKSGYGYRCSECGAIYNKRKSRLNFCPNCGADMREVEK